MRSATEKAKTGLIKRSYPAGQTPLASHPKHRDMHFYSIGEFYQAIAEGIEHLEHKAHKQGKTIFTGDPSKQITSEYYYSGGGELHPVTISIPPNRVSSSLSSKGRVMAAGSTITSTSLLTTIDSMSFRRGVITRRATTPAHRPARPAGGLECCLSDQTKCQACRHPTS